MPNAHRSHTSRPRARPVVAEDAGWGGTGDRNVTYGRVGSVASPSCPIPDGMSALRGVTPALAVGAGPSLPVVVLVMLGDRDAGWRLALVTAMAACVAGLAAARWRGACRASG